MTDMKPNLDRFLSSLDDAQIAAIISEKSGIPVDEALSQFTKYKNEAYFALRVVEKHLKSSERILECGAGAGVFSYFLCHEGYDIMALEPVGIGYDFMRGAFEALREVLPKLKLKHLNIGAEALDPVEHGTFDMIFSIHVLEHLPAFKEGLTAMESVLAPAGHMVHVCPNYYFPYDPHFSIPLVPIWPKMTELFLSKDTKDSGKWKSINFINYGRIKRQANALDLNIDLEPSMFTEMIKRVETDKEFGARHGKGISGTLIKFLKATKLLGLVKLYPTKLSSPITFELKRG